MKQNLTVIAVLFSLTVGLFALFPAVTVGAQINPGDPDVVNQPCQTQSFLTFPAWYRGIVGSDCSILSPTEVGGIANFIWMIALNVIEMLLRLTGFAAVFFIIYGGYKYMISAGSSEGIVGAKKTITNAVIGLVISIAAVAIVRTVSIGIGLGG